MLFQDFHRFGVTVGVLLLPLGADLLYSADTPRHNAGLHEAHDPGNPGLYIGRCQAGLLVGDGGSFKYDIRLSSIFFILYAGRPAE